MSGPPDGDESSQDGDGRAGDTASRLPPSLERLWQPSSEGGAFARDLIVSVALVGLLALVLFGVSGIWPPLVAVESGSMNPNIHQGDLIFVVDEDRFVGPNATADTGVVTRANSSSHETFGQAGDVIIFRPNGLPTETPVIHRAHFWVEEDENWVESKANTEFTGGASCSEVTTCPARHDGFVTKGDANAGYDQFPGGAETDIVKPEWITGKAQLRIPWLGHVRLTFDTFFS